MRDPIHGFISFEKEGLVNKIIDTIEFQRLKYIRQLGVSCFTYPSANHTRFTHAIGTYHLAKKAFEAMNLDEDYLEDFSLAALLHDLGHGPLSHALESQLLPGISHEAICSEMITSSNMRISDLLNDNGVKPERLTTILFSGSKPTFLHRLISSQLDIDRFDYLLRDSWMTGNPHGVFDLDRILHSIQLNENEDLYVSRKGWDAVENFLYCRYQMYKQVYYHHATIGVEELLKKVMKRAGKLVDQIESSLSGDLVLLLKDEGSLENFVKLTDTDILNLVKVGNDSSDKILRDLSNRILCRNLLKPVVLQGEMALNTLGIEDDIKKSIESQDYDCDYYYSSVNISIMKTYKPYTPNPKDQEEAIYISPEHDLEISQEMPSLGAIAPPQVVYLFMPDECRERVSELVS